MKPMVCQGSCERHQTALSHRPCNGTLERLGLPYCCIRRSCTAGERLWGRQLGIPLARAEWSPDGQRILFAGGAGGCHVYGAAGDALAQLALPAGQVRPE